MKRKKVSIYGATGVVGGKALEVIKAFPALFRVDVLAAWSNAEKLARLARQSGAYKVVLADEKGAHILKNMLEGTGIRYAVGAQAYREAAQRPVDCFVAAMGGIGGLDALLEAIPQTQQLLIANKEALVVAGALVMQKARQYGCRVILLDSEHYAGWLLARCGEESLRSLILTASGGPFLKHSAEALTKVTTQEAINHPVWKMGAKISVDSATLMNKALELLEAQAFFDLPETALSVVIHPECLVHAFVEDSVGVFHSLVSSPDMLFSVAGGLFYPDPSPSFGPNVEMIALETLHFEENQEHRFPALSLGRDVLRGGWCDAVVFNAANDICVDGFLKEMLPFSSIVSTVECVLSAMYARVPRGDFSLEALKALDARTRTMAWQFVHKQHDQHSAEELRS